MNKKIVSIAAGLFAGLTSALSLEANSMIVEKDGMLIIEAESMSLKGKWEVAEDTVAAEGKYIHFTGANYYGGVNANHTSEVKFKINNPGSYLVKWLMRQPDESEGDKSNDAWINFPDAVQTAKGKVLHGFHKFVGRSKTEFGWNGTVMYHTDKLNANGDVVLDADGNPKQVEASAWFKVNFEEAGEYTLELSGRSEEFQLDRIVIFKGIDDADASVAQATMVEQREEPTYAVTIKSTDTNATAEAEFKKVLAQGGTITFEAGNWTIDLGNSTKDALGDVTIIGQNLTDPSNPDMMGAYEDNQFVQTTLTMTGSSMNLTDSCENLTIKNIKWEEVGLEVQPRHQPTVDLDNVFFDLSSWSTTAYHKNIFDTNDGIQGTIDHCSFLDFGMRAIKINRSVDQGEYPLSTVGKLTVNRCKFRPDSSLFNTKNVVGLNHDSGNDEYAPTTDYSGKEIINSRFIECGISMSKASNMIIAHNVFENELSVSEPLHLEEFSNDITINDNTFVMAGSIKRNCITVGAQQTCHDITVSDNVVDQTNQLESFIAGAGIKNLFVTGNEIMNASQSEDYISFWGVNNLNVQIGENQPGLSSNQVNIASATEAPPVADGNYYMIWDNDLYLGLENGEVTFTQLSEPPTENRYKWKLTSRKVGYMNNYSTIENLDGSSFLLEVLKGPNNPEQQDFLNQKPVVTKPYLFQNDPVYAKAVGTYADQNRQPGFSIFQENGAFCLMPGGNELRSQIIKNGDYAQVYMVTDETDADYNWSFVEASYEAVPVVEAIQMTNLPTSYDSATTSFPVAVAYSAKQERDILVALKDPSNAFMASAIRTVEAGAGTLNVNLTVNSTISAGTGYKFFAVIREAGGNWETNVIHQNIPVEFTAESTKLTLVEGFQFVSLDIVPQETNIQTLFGSALGNIEFIEDQDGNRLQKVNGNWVNGLAAWDSTQAYLIKATGTASISIASSGTAAPETQLRTGVNLVPTSVDSTQSPEQLYSTILDSHIVWVKDLNGNYLRKVNGKWINSIREVKAKSGLIIKASQSGPLTQ